MRTLSGFFATAVVGLAGAVSSLGQDCTGTTGPDVIVGDLTGPANYSSLNGIEAFSMGTTSCNIGDTWLNWIADTNQHPVISQNLYKVKNVGGYWTFEQLGQSWLKHGFFALSQELCCTDCQATDGSHLGVRCSDPYTAERNGGQGGAGPKWQVNAWTGEFTYPPANPAFSGSVARRLQIKTADLEPTSTTVGYFGEAQYIVSDEPDANRYNNASHRGVLVTGSGSAWTMSFPGTSITVREKAAITAWGSRDPGVVVRDVDIPGEGRFLIGAKATALPNNVWHYEYAVFNMNSDRSAGGFSVPVPTGVTVSNLGFHDVDYHSGDGPGNVNYAGTDWASSAGNGAVSWSTETFEQNASANALRWGTLYNFRFDANAAPTTGSVTLSLFKPGTPTQVAGAGFPVPSAPAVVPGDVNGDGHVDLTDLALLLTAFGACTGNPTYNAAADFNSNGCVDLPDLAVLLANFGA